MPACHATSDRNIFRRPGSPYYWLRFHLHGHKVRVSLKTADLKEARKRRDVYVARHHVDGLDVQTAEWRQRCRAAADDGKSWLRALWARANRRNRQMGAGRQMSIKAVYAVAMKSRGRCAVTGIPFAWHGDTPVRGAYAISLDRIKSGKPYCTSNCRMVIRAVNLAMNVWGEDVFWEISRKAVGRSLIHNERI